MSFYYCPDMCNVMLTRGLSCNLQVTSKCGAICWSRHYFTMRWSLCMLWGPSMGWRVPGDRQYLAQNFDTSWCFCAPAQLLALGVLVHVSIEDAQLLTAEWSVKSLAGSTNPVGSGVAPGKFLFLRWKVSRQTLKWIVWGFLFAVLL